MPRSVPQDSNTGTLIIACMLWWPNSQTKRPECRGLELLLGLCRKSKAENTWYHVSESCTDFFLTKMIKKQIKKKLDNREKYKK